MIRDLHGHRQPEANTALNPGGMIARAVVCASLAAGFVLVPHTASAEISRTDRSSARSLFDEGRELMEAGNYAVACPKFAESQRLDPGSGTMLNLALCHEKQGKIATAYIEFGEARAVAAREQNELRERAASEHLAALKPHVSYLTVVVAENVEGLSVTIDGDQVSRAVLGSRIASDSGEHTVEASAPGKKTWTKKVIVGENGDKVAVQVPVLESQSLALPVAAAATAAVTPIRPLPAQPPKPAPAEHTNSTAVAAYIVGGAGIVVLGVGAGFGFAARSKWQDAQAQNSPSMSDTALTYARICDVGIGVGVAGIVVGTVLLLIHGPKETPKQGLRFAPAVTANGGGFELGGAW